MSVCSVPYWISPGNVISWRWGWRSWKLPVQLDKPVFSPKLS